MADNKESSTNVSLIDGVIQLMLYGHNPDEDHYKRIVASRKTLEKLDDYVTYNLNYLDNNQSCTFYVQESEPWIKEIVAEYLVVRFGTLSTTFLQEAYLNARSEAISVPEKGGKGYKQFVEKCIEYVDGNYKTVWLGKVRKKISKLSLELFNQDEHVFRDNSERNILVCSDQDIKMTSNSFFKNDYDSSFTINSHLSVITAKEDANSIINPIRQYIQKEAKKAMAAHKSYEPAKTNGNVFLIYSGEQRSKRIGSFNRIFQNNLSQFAFQTKLFVIAFPICNYRLDRMLRVKELFKGVFNPNDELYLDYEEEKSIHPSLKEDKYERFICKFDDNRDLINDEIHSIVDGLDYIRSTMNVLSLCCTERCEDLFFDDIKNKVPEYEVPDIQLLFEAIRQQWKDTIIPKINDFVSLGERFAMLVDYWTPESIKEEINGLFDNRITFISANSFKKNQYYENAIDCSRIVVMRYIPCTNHPSSYPNSYDPYVLRDNQKLLEIISELMFHGHIIKSLNNLNSHLNKTLDSDYRRARGWKRKQMRNPINDDIFFAMNYDDVVDYGEDSSNRTVLVCFTNGRNTHPAETEPVIYQLKDDNLGVTRLKNLVGRQDIKGIQFLSDMERRLEPYVNKLIAKDEEQEQILRQKWSKEFGVDLNVPGEIWRLLLNYKIQTKGFDKVCEELAPNISDSNKIQVIKDWSNLDKKMTLPGRRTSRKAVLEYLGIPVGSPYSMIIERKSRRRRRVSKQNNMLIDSLLMEVIGRDLSSNLYMIVQRDLQDSLDYFGISDSDSFCDLYGKIHEQVNISTIKTITDDNEL